MKEKYFYKSWEGKTEGPLDLHTILDEIMVGRLPEETRVALSYSGPWMLPKNVKGQWWNGIMHRASVAGILQLVCAWFVAQALFCLAVMVMDYASGPEGAAKAYAALTSFSAALLCAVGAFALAEILTRLRQISIALRTTKKG